IMSLKRRERIYNPDGLFFHEHENTKASKCPVDLFIMSLEIGERIYNPDWLFFRKPKIRGRAKV
ncbi:TPA: hypothetical protein ACGOY4_001491, partial [Streptococcus suis]